MSLDPRSIATLGVGYGARALAYLGLWPTTVPAPTPHREIGRSGRSHTIVRVPKRLVRREVQTPDGPLIILVPDDWTTDDLMTLTTALVLTDALD